MKRIKWIFIFSLIFLGCTEQLAFKVLHSIPNKENNEISQFSLMTNTSIDFKNQVNETEELNFLNFSYIYNGAGIVAADFNNDGLADIFLLANQGENRLYLNKGDFKFEDITDTAGISDSSGWTTGASTIDINNDGWLDIYICKSGMVKNEVRENRLYINQQNNTFKESAKEWKLNDNGFSTQSYFLDFDKDGDLDMYLVNHRFDFHNSSLLKMEIEKANSNYTTDKLFRNDGKHFTEVTETAGLTNNAWGLSASIGDFNHDDWPDIYVCNDFISPDMLYINNQDGTFSDEILERMNHISFNSMGSDYADINNDQLPDLLVLEMAAEDHVRSKENMPSMSSQNFNDMVEADYHHQYMINTLQINNKNGQYSEIAQLAGIAKTDWSWAPLISDFDNDGLKDVFITNGILKELGNQDYKNSLIEKFSKDNHPSFDEVVNNFPSNKLSNYSFKNNGDLSFTNTSVQWGFDAKTQSNGVAYADFDNDGDLDLVVNNINDKAQVYRNNDTHNFIQLRLKGNKENPFATGAKITMTIGGQKQYQELYMSRGYLSSVHPIINFGVNTATKIDEILIEWPDEKVTKLTNVEANQIILVDEEIAKELASEENKEDQLLTEIWPGKKGIQYKHRENEFDDFKNQILLPYSQSTNGPFIDSADVNNDGLDDFFVGGAAGQSAELYLQSTNGKFNRQVSKVWLDDREYEDLGVLFFDADGDSDIDLYVVSGGSEFKPQSIMFQDRLYLNDGSGNFTKSNNGLPKITSSGQCVKASDIDNDGDLDLFVGGRVIPDKYPYAPESYILINEGGKFQNKTIEIAPDIANVGMVTDAIFSDYDNDGDQDLIIVGEWMPITIYKNHGGKLELENTPSLDDTEGIWFSISSSDIDKDGDQDYIIGNLGENSKFKVSKEKPFHLFCDDFDNSGTYDIVFTSNYKGNMVPARGRECLSQQMPFIKDKFPTFSTFAKATLQDVYGEEALGKALHLSVKTLESVCLENLGGGKFNIMKLPNIAHFSPIMDVDFLDINNDGSNEIIIIGNHYNSEVETPRYDASYGTVLSYRDGKFLVNSSTQTGFFNKGNSKNMTVINSQKEKLILITNNNNRLKMFSIRK